MIENNKPVLSICIPTYNRCGYLYLTLQSIVEQDLFKNTYDIEIVICDNCSDDFTQTIAKIFIDQFPDKIKYHRNETNIGDKNFERVLTYATGEVLKLHNDNFTIINGELKIIVDKIKEMREEKSMIFFANGNSPLEKDMMCNDLNEFISATSYLTTWIAAFSIWKEDFDNFEEFSKNVETQLMQTDVLFRFSARGKKIFVFNELVFEGQGVLKKGGYNVSKIFGKNYLSLLKAYLKSGELDKRIYENEKKRLLLKHIIPMKFSSSRRENGWNFKNDGYWRHLIKDYWANLYFYTSIIQILRLILDAEINLVGRKLNPNSYQKYWRKRNRHNQTTISKNIDAIKVFVGKNCTGHIDAQFSDNEREILIISDNVNLKNDTKFTFDSSELIIVENDSIITESTMPSAVLN